MPTEKSAGAVIFRREAGKILYLLLHYTPQPGKKRREYWDFSKGHIEEGETPKVATIREIEEETGITDLEFKEEFKKHIKYFFVVEEKKIFKMVTLFLAETKIKDVVISFEHEGYKWLEFNEALKEMRFKNAKKTLTEAQAFLTEKNIGNT